MTHLFCTAGHSLLTVQVLLQWTRDFQRQALPQDSKSRDFFFSGNYEQGVCESRKCLSHMWPSVNLLEQNTWLGVREGPSLSWLACLSQHSLPSDNPHRCDLQFNIVGTINCFYEPPTLLSKLLYTLNYCYIRSKHRDDPSLRAAAGQNIMRDATILF